MTGLADVVAVIIAGAVVLAVLLGGLAVIAHRGRRVNVTIDIGEPDDNELEAE